MFLDDKGKTRKNIILYHSAEKGQLISAFLCLFTIKKLYILKLSSQIIAVAETEVSRNTLFAEFFVA